MRKMLPITATFAIVIASVALAPSAALAQVQSPGYPNTAYPSPALKDNDQMPPAVANPSDTNKTNASPVAGKNSFTEGQARSRLEENGYDNVMNLAKDEDSIWRARASRNGNPVTVTVDYQGNINEQ